MRVFPNETRHGQIVSDCENRMGIPKTVFEFRKSIGNSQIRSLTPKTVRYSRNPFLHSEIRFPRRELVAQIITAPAKAGAVTERAYVAICVTASLQSV